ncbi:MAG TPA: hypothetical protein VFP87_04500, partial [Chitinophagaceae bacterium]|nr:hypothetical protein [Chitinophagaceae bacterium]
ITKSTSIEDRRAAALRFNLNVDWLFYRGFTFLAQNFTGNKTPDWDAASPVPGTSWMFGLRLTFARSMKS